MRYRSQPGASLRWISRSVLIVFIMLSAACSSKGAKLDNPVQTPPQKATVTNTSTSDTPLLPGEQKWNGDSSSFLFGTNDTQEWYNKNVETTPGIQQALKNAHFTLMRTFFFNKSLADNHPTTDAEIELRLKTVENSGMICLGVLHSIFDIPFVEHVVTYAGPRCRIYEFGNEVDYQGVSIKSYLQQWNKVIPLLRNINPQAKFIGPVTYNDQGNHFFMRAFLEGVKSSGILPDAISFHWYPCYENTEVECLNRASSYGQVALGVEEMVRSILGKNLPVGITEWNYDPSLSPPAYGDKATFMTQFSANALHSMILARVAFACQFDAASYGGYGRLDMFNVETGQPKPQYYTIKDLIQSYRPSSK